MTTEPKTKKAKPANGSADTSDFKEKMWQAADKLRTGSSPAPRKTAATATVPAKPFSVTPAKSASCQTAPIATFRMKTSPVSSTPTITTLRGELLPRLMSGELRVKEAEKELIKAGI